MQSYRFNANMSVYSRCHRLGFVLETPVDRPKSKPCLEISPPAFSLSLMKRKGLVGRCNAHVHGKTHFPRVLTVSRRIARSLLNDLTPLPLMTSFRVPLHFLEDAEFHDTGSSRHGRIWN